MGFSTCILFVVRADVCSLQSLPLINKFENWEDMTDAQTYVVKRNSKNGMNKIMSQKYTKCADTINNQKTNMME